MKTIIQYIAVFLTAVAAVFPAKSEVTPTEGKFSAELKASLLSRVSFSKSKDAIQVRALEKGTLPLEFIKRQGLEESDGILVEGDSFAWPGCGFDRTSYQVERVTVEYVEIRYSRGIPQQDGYHDSGVFRIPYSNP